MKSQIYDQAKYYEIAFSFIDPKKQSDLFEQFIKKYSHRKVTAVLDICCGTALQLRQLAKRGYQSIGLDASSKMLEYLKNESRKEDLKIETIKADLNNFKLKQKIDFAFIMMGSIAYTRNNKLFLSHLNSVANCLNSGGLYLIENMDINWVDPKFWKSQTWTMRRGKIKVKTTFQLIPQNLLEQKVIQFLKLEVDDDGKKMSFIDNDEAKVTSPEELKLLIAQNGQFEFIGFFERSKVKLLKKISSDNIVLLRKK